MWNRGERRMHICSGTVTYNPEIDLLSNHLMSICSQVETAYIVDNGSCNSDDIKNLIAKFSNVKYISNSKNYGIARALNQLFENAINDNFAWIVTLDQDSVFPIGGVKKLWSEIEDYENTGIMAPIIVDRINGVVGHSPNKKKEVRTCITSGALTSILCWKDIGGFDEKMFIDSVDFDYCFRLRKKGYKVYQSPVVHLEHSLGEGSVHHFLFWKVKIFEHSSFRHYYMAQNRIYFPKKNHSFFRLIRGNIRNAKQIISIILFDSKKKEKIYMVLKGWLNGYKL